MGNEKNIKDETLNEVSGGITVMAGDGAHIGGGGTKSSDVQKGSHFVKSGESVKGVVKESVKEVVKESVKEVVKETSIAKAVEDEKIPF